MGILEDIVRVKREEIPGLRARRLPAPPPLVPVSLARGAGEPLRLICEIKLKSPSAGELSRTLGVGDRARAYESAGATMISVLCDGPFFGGGYEDLATARAACALPLLCKEFILDPCQLDAARAYGASAALLIVRCLTPTSLRELVQAAEERQLIPLVEVTDEAESALAIDAGARFFGVNARDLDDLSLDTGRAHRVLESLPPSAVRCHFSGLKTPDAVARVAAGRADAALMGEALMRQDDPTALLQSFVRAARGELT